MTIQVTQEDIDSGAFNSICRGPLNSAINRCLPEDCWSEVFLEIFIVYKVGISQGTIYEIPKEGQNFILAFDSNKEVQPLFFEAFPK